MEYGAHCTEHCGCIKEMGILECMHCANQLLLVAAGELTVEGLSILPWTGLV